MYTTNDVKNLAGLAWDEFFRLVDHQQAQFVKQPSSLPIQTKYNDDVAVLPHKKATCYGSCSVTETPKLIKCQSCNLVVKTVAFGHHQKIHHSHFCSPTRRSISSDSDSDDDCQGFLLSPPHHPTPTVSSSSETMLDLKIVEDTKWTVSDSVKSHTPLGEIKTKNDNKKIARQSPPRYDVQRRNDLRLVLTKRRNSITRTTRANKGGIARTCNNQSEAAPPLVSISITRSSGQKRNHIQITEHNLASKQTIEEDKAQGCTMGRVKVNEKYNKNAKWSNVQLTEDIYTADLEESEQSSIPLHHSPSESSDSDAEENEQGVQMGRELFESYPMSSCDFVREHCPMTQPVSNTAIWNPRKTAERPSIVNKSNNMALLHKMHQKLALIPQQNHGALNRTPGQPFDHKRTVGKGKNHQSERSPEMDVVVEKLFKIQGISVTALSPDGKRKVSVPTKPNSHILSNALRADSLNYHHFSNEKGSQDRPRVSLPISQQQQPTAKRSFQARLISPSVSSPSVSSPSVSSPSITTTFTSSSISLADKSSLTAKSGDLDTTTTEDGSQLQRREGDSPIVGTFLAKQKSTHHKTSTSFGGSVSWRKLDSPQSQNVTEGPTAMNSQKGTLRFVTLPNSANGNAVQQRQEDINEWPKKMGKTHPIRGITRNSSPFEAISEIYDDDSQPMQFDEIHHGPEIVCHTQQNVRQSSDGSVFLGQNAIRKRSFIQQQMPYTPKHQMLQQEPIVAKRIRPIAPRKNDGAVRMCGVEDKFKPFSAQSRSCVGMPSQQNLHCRFSNQTQQTMPNPYNSMPLSKSKRLQPDIVVDQRFQPKIFSVFAPSSPFGDPPPVHVGQLSPPGDLRTFGRQSRQQFNIKHQPSQSVSARQLRTQTSSFGVPLDDDARTVKLYDHQIGGVHGSADLLTQRMAPEYSYFQTGKTAPACAQLQRCQPYGQMDSVVTSPNLPCSSHSLSQHSHDESPQCPPLAFVFGTSPPLHPPPQPSFNALFPPPVRHLSESLQPQQPQQNYGYQQQQQLSHPHFHALLPSVQCRHICVGPPPPPAPQQLQNASSSMQSQFVTCRGSVFAGMPAPQSEPFFAPSSYAFQQCQHINSPHFMRGQQQQQHVATYNNEMDTESFAIEPPPVLEAEGNISTAEDGPMRFEEGGGGVTTRSESDASDMDLREILPPQQQQQ